MFTYIMVPIYSVETGYSFDFGFECVMEYHHQLQGHLIQYSSFYEK